MEAINERIKDLIKELGLSPSSFARKIGKAQSSVAVIVDGRSKPGYDFLELISREFPQVSRDWLLMGEGEIFRSDTQVQAKPTDNYLQDFLQKLEEKFQRQLDRKDEQIASLSRMLEMTLGNPELGKELANSLVTSELEPEEATQPKPLTVIMGLYSNKRAGLFAQG